ncbi:MAG: replication protein [Candidatus Pacearchaeota archaeon]
MASPQKENGFTPIANEILERLVNISLLGAEFQILFFIIRKTYGYHKKEDRISLTQFEKGTGLSRPTVVKTLKNLMARNMIVKIYLPDENKGYSFVKDHEKWVVKTHLLVKGKWETSKDVLTETSKDVLTHKRKKDNKRNIVASDIPFSLKEEIGKLEDSARRDLNIIALYLDHRKPDLQTREQYEETLKRHLKPAGKLKSFTNDQILKALSYAKKEYNEIYTIETLLKILTK